MPSGAPNEEKINGIFLDEKVAEEINLLLAQLYNDFKPLTIKEVGAVAKNLNSYMAFISDSNGVVRGLGCIYFVKTLRGLVGIIRDVVVDENYQGENPKKKILMKLIDEAKKREAMLVKWDKNNIF